VRNISYLNSGFEFQPSNALEKFNYACGVRQAVIPILIWEISLQAVQRLTEFLQPNVVERS
jgi:hypothetical protein